MKYLLITLSGLLLAAVVYQKRSGSTININLRKLEDRLGLPFGFFPMITNEKIVAALSPSGAS